MVHIMKQHTIFLRIIKYLELDINSFVKYVLKKKYYLEAQSLLKENRCSTHPHNLYLEILSESGIVGFLLFICCIYFIFQSICRKSIRNKYIIIQILIYFFPFISTGSFYKQKFNILIFCYYCKFDYK